MATAVEFYVLANNKPKNSEAEGGMLLLLVKNFIHQV